MTKLLEVHDLVRHYPVRSPNSFFGTPATLKAVDGLSFSLSTGKTLGLVGESGCGKSTTARLVLGLMPATSGQVFFEGAPVSARRGAAWRALRRRMQMVYQDPLGALDRRLPVLSQVAEPLLVFRQGTAPERLEKARDLMASVGLPAHLFERYPHELSGGQRQRVVLARALIMQPSLLVCDEPISSLDVSIQAQVMNLLHDIQDKFGVSLLFISHDLKVVRQVSHEVAVMYLGRIIEQGPPDELFQRPAHPYTQALVSAIPSLIKDGQPRRIMLEGDPPNPVNVPSGCSFHTRCASVMPICRVQRPELADVGQGRKAACHLHSQPTQAVPC